MFGTQWVLKVMASMNLDFNYNMTLKGKLQFAFRIYQRKIKSVYIFQKIQTFDGIPILMLGIQINPFLEFYLP